MNEVVHIIEGEIHGPEARNGVNGVQGGSWFWTNIWNDAPLRIEIFVDGWAQIALQRVVSNFGETARGLIRNYVTDRLGRGWIPRPGEQVTINEYQLMELYKNRNRGAWAFGTLNGPIPKYDPQRAEGGFGFSVKCKNGQQEKWIEIRVLEQSRQKAAEWADADGVDKLLSKLVLLELSNLSQQGWEPNSMVITLEKLKQLNDARERALLADEQEARKGEE